MKAAYFIRQYNYSCLLLNSVSLLCMCPTATSTRCMLRRVIPTAERLPSVAWRRRELMIPTPAPTCRPDSPWRTYAGTRRRTLCADVHSSPFVCIIIIIIMC